MDKMVLGLKKMPFKCMLMRNLICGGRTCIRRELRDRDSAAIHRRRAMAFAMLRLCDGQN